MITAAFDYEAPESLEEAIRICEEAGSYRVIRASDPR